MEELRELIPLLIPIVILQLILIVVALLDLSRLVQTRGPKWAWVLVILFINLIGPIVYFAIGREEA
jgi:hypothetical protein